MTQGSLPTRLRVLRAERSLTLRDAASLTGLRPGTLSELERGLRHPHDITLARIAKGYGVPVEDLLEAEEAQDLPETSQGKVEAPQESGPSDRLEGPVLASPGKDEAFDETAPFKMPVERITPEPSTREERIESLRDSTKECLDMAAEALREFEVLKQSGTKRQLEILGDRALCTYLGAAYLTNLALQASNRQGTPKDDEERRASEDAVRAVNELGDAAGEIMEVSRTSGTLIGMREFQLRRGTG